MCRRPITFNHQKHENYSFDFSSGSNNGLTNRIHDILKKVQQATKEKSFLPKGMQVIIP
jgi:hypothetical protein